METVLITGGTGLVGSAITEYLIKKGYKIIILTRHLKNAQSTNQVSYALWNIPSKTIDTAAIQKADYIIHLAGAGVVDKKWTPAYKKEILDSRTKSIELIIETLQTNTHKVKAIISASAIGWYGPDKITGHSFTEDEKPSNDFLGETCRLWEQSVDAASALNIRACKLRTGIVLSKNAGALTEFINPIRWGLAAILGNGKQIVSWIHIDDLCRMYLAAIENQAMAGSYNAVATTTVTNKELTIQLAESIKGKFYLPMHVPKFILQIMMGCRSIEVLKSTAVSNEKIKKTGFTFLYPTLSAALNNFYPGTNKKVVEK